MRFHRKKISCVKVVIKRSMYCWLESCGRCCPLFPSFFVNLIVRSIRSRLRDAALITTPFVHWTSIFGNWRLAVICPNRFIATREWRWGFMRRAIRTQISSVGGIMIPSSTRARFFNDAINLFPVRNFRRSSAGYVPREITLFSIRLQSSLYQRDSALLAIARSCCCHCALPLADCNSANGETRIL